MEDENGAELADEASSVLRLEMADTSPSVEERAEVDTVKEGEVSDTDTGAGEAAPRLEGQWSARSQQQSRLCTQVSSSQKQSAAWPPHRSRQLPVVAQLWLVFGKFLSSWEMFGLSVAASWPPVLAAAVVAPWCTDDSVETVELDELAAEDSSFVNVTLVVGLSSCVVSTTACVVF